MKDYSDSQISTGDYIVWSSLIQDPDTLDHQLSIMRASGWLNIQATPLMDFQGHLICWNVTAYAVRR